MANSEQFEAMIGQLMATDNNIRGQAEKVFNEAKNSPDFLVSRLIQFLRNSQHEQVKMMCGILLRKLIGKNKDSLWAKISPQTQAVVKTQLLEALQHEVSPTVRNRIADCVAELATSIFESGQWKELLPFLFQSTKSQREMDRETALQIFSQLAPDLGEQLRPHFAILKEVLSTGLNDTQSLKVRIAALTATANFLQVLSEDNERKEFQQLLPAMLGCVSAALNAQEEEEARAAMELFVDLAELDPTFLRPHLSHLIPAMQMIASTSTLEDSTRQLGVEFLVTLAENKPGMVRRYPNYLDSLLPIIINMMLDLDDDDSWGEDEDDDDVDITNSDIGEESLDRISLALGGKEIVPLLFRMIPVLLQDPDWKKRHAALMAISIIGEGCHKAMAHNLGEIVKTFLPFFRDPHRRVRWAACNTAGQMSSDFGPTFQLRHHGDVLPALIGVMDDSANPRVQSHAASAVINFCEHATPELLLPYLDALVHKLMSLLQNGKIIVQEQVVTAIAAIADCLQGEFVRYYDSLVPFLKTILSNANTKEYRTLRGKAMECVTLIGVAVGKEKFYQDAKDIMEQMLRTQSVQLESDDPQTSFLLQAWARICRCMGKDFVPYLEHVMPPLLNSASLKPDVKIADPEAEGYEGWEYVPVGDKRIGINTSALEEKSTACNMLFCYASELEEGFFPYVDTVAKLLVPLMLFYYHDGVRSAALSTMPHLLISAKKYLQQQAASGADQTYMRQLFNFICPTMQESLMGEIDLELLVLAIESFTECLDALGENGLSDEQFASTIQVIQHLFSEIGTRRRERKARHNEEDHDDEEEERISEEEERDQEIVSQLAELIGHLAQHQKNFFSFFEPLLPVLQELLKPTSQPSDRQAGLCIFDDVVEHQGPTAAPLVGLVLPVAMQYVADVDHTVRQAAVYGLGVVAQMGGPQVVGVIPEMYSRLRYAITLPDARVDPYANPSENAIGAVAKILVHHPSAVDGAQAIPEWLSWLPLTSDKIESKITYRLFCELLESNNPHVLGEAFQHLPHILNIFAQILGTDFLNEEVSARIVNNVRQLQTRVPADVLQNAWSSLGPERQQKLQSFLQ